tara:strand:- start:212 stop:673 length:462 start_codon:yes stop_codon:yes gene_type:complete
MITFSKKSWHYKFNEFFEYKDGPWLDARDCKSICTYFWSTVWNMAWSVLILGILYILTLLVGAAALDGCLGVNVSELPLWYLYVWLVGIVTLVIVFTISFVTFFGVFTGYDKLTDKIKNRNSDENNVDKQPNIFVEWVKAKKSKVCPMIEFKE